MSDPTLPPVTPTADARNRAVRVLLNGFLVDVAVAVALVLASAMADSHFAWTAEFWRVVGLTVAKTIIMSAVSYIMRLKMPPPAPEA